MRTATEAAQNCTTGIGLIPWRVIRVEALHSFKLFVRFADGVEGVVDMGSFLSRDCGVFKVGGFNLQPQQLMFRLGFSEFHV